MRADGHEQFAVAGELGNRMDAVIDAVDGVLGTDVDAVSAVPEDASSEATNEIAVLVEHHDREVRVSAECVHVVLGVDGDTRSLDQPGSLRQLVPVEHVLISEVAFAQNCAHVRSP